MSFRQAGTRGLVACAAVAAVALFASGSVGAKGSTVPPCGTTLHASVVLSADMNCSSGGTNGLEIGADNVTVDLNGHSIIGAGVNDDYDGIYNDGNDGLKVKNGTIKDFDVGIYTNYAHGTTIKNVLIQFAFPADPYDDAYGVWLDRPGGDLLDNVTVTNTGATDVCCSDSTGIYVDHAYSGPVTVTNSTANALDYGFHDNDSSDYGYSDLWKNNVSNGVYDDTDGFYDYYGNGNQYIGDRAYSGHDGFRVYEGPVVITNSLASGNENDGLYMYEAYDGTTGSTISKNTFLHNASDGMYDYQSEYSIFSGNKAVGNDSDGFDINYTGYATVTKNTATANGDDGFDIYGWNWIMATKNTAKGNGSDGFTIGDINPGSGDLSKNTAKSNGGWGLWAAVNLPGKGNKASGNCSITINNGTGC